MYTSNRKRKNNREAVSGVIIPYRLLQTATMDLLGRHVEFLETAILIRLGLAHIAGRYTRR